MQAKFKHFESDRSWESLFQTAADFLTQIGPERTIGVSHSHQGPMGVVTVWYWSDEPTEKGSNQPRHSN